MPVDRRCPWLLAPLLLRLLLLGGCASMQPEPEQQAEAESGATEVQMAVKTALLEASGVAATPVRVEVSDQGRVQLSGYVSSPEESRRVEQAARQALPEAEIDNALRVWSPAERNDVAGSDTPP